MSEFRVNQMNSLSGQYKRLRRQRSAGTLFLSQWAVGQPSSQVRQSPSPQQLFFVVNELNTPGLQTARLTRRDLIQY